MTRHPWRMLLLAICAGGWTAAWIITHLPPRDIPHMEVGDKVLHVTGYFLIALAFGALLAAYGVRSLRRAIIMITVMALYGVFDELTQPYFGRSADVMDWLADLHGTVLAVLVLQLLTTVIFKRR
ncbi:MAG: VanZ family protein [Planctomycetaceae bacterium]|nr:VanZ family protein [Planctomycetaceae bacterium]